MLKKLNKLKLWQASAIIILLGIAVYFTGLTNPFQGDDIYQIVNNPPVHSLTNIRIFFEGGTIYNGADPNTLVGVFYRPLMTVVFSFLYTLFGPHTIYFHVFQLALFIGGCIILYLYFKYTFKPVLALFLALIFLVHPINSQVVFSIPCMQDVLCFFFGISALYILNRFKSFGSLMIVAACLFFSLLSKETGILFIAMSVLSLFWYDKKRLYPFLGILLVPLALYAALRINAIGLLPQQFSAPIDKLSLAGRLFTSPSIVLFYITKFIFPWKLATAYYWVYPTFSIGHFLLPLIIDLAVLALFVYAALFIRKNAPKAIYYSYRFFAVWAAIGMILIVQIIPLDMTVSEFWFYFPMIGLLGMIGIILKVLSKHMYIDSRIIIILMIAIILVLGIRTAARGTDWANPVTLAYKDSKISKDDYSADMAWSQSLFNQGKYSEAKIYAQRSINIFPNYINYLLLGNILARMGDYSGALNTYLRCLKYGSASAVYENIGTLLIVYGNPKLDREFIQDELKTYPQDAKLWMDLAILDDEYHDNHDAKAAIIIASSYAQVPQDVYNAILSDQPFTMYFSELGKTLRIA